MWADTIQFRVRHGNSGWEAAIFNSKTNVDLGSIDFGNGFAWGAGTYHQQIDWAASTGTAQYQIWDSSNNQIMNAGNVIDGLMGLSPSKIVLEGKDWQDATTDKPDPNVSMTIDDGPIIITIGGDVNDPWYTQDINVAALPHITLTGTFYFTDDYFDIFSAENLKAQVSMKNFVAPVPIPGAVWLLGSGLIGLMGIRRKFR